MALKKTTIKRVKRVVATLKRRGDPTSLRAARQIVATVKDASKPQLRGRKGRGRRTAGLTLLANNREVAQLFEEAGRNALADIQGGLVKFTAKKLVKHTRGMRLAMRREYGVKGERELERVMGGFIKAVLADTTDALPTIADEVMDHVAQDEMVEEPMEEEDELDLDIDVDEGATDPWRESQDDAMPPMDDGDEMDFDEEDVDLAMRFSSDDEDADDMGGGDEMEELDVELEEEPADEEVAFASASKKLRKIAYRVRMNGDDKLADHIASLLAK